MKLVPRTRLSPDEGQTLDGRSIARLRALAGKTSNVASWMPPLPEVASARHAREHARTWGGGALAPAGAGGAS